MKPKTRTTYGLVGTAALAFFVLVWANWNTIRFYHDLGRIQQVIDRGEQGWGDRASKMLHELQARADDKHWMAELLLDRNRDADSDNGCLAAEGLIMLVRYEHPDAKRILKEHLDDESWNWFLTNNAYVAKELLKVIELRQKEKLAERETAFVEKWVGFGPK